METKILGFSGRKQSGKNTAANYLLGLFMKNVELIEDFKVNTRGQLEVTDILGNTEYAGVFDLNDKSEAMRSFRAEYLDSLIRIYSFADLLKEISMVMFGLSYEQCYGTDEQKNTYTNLDWENMPGVTTVEPPEKPTPVTGRMGKYYEKLASGLVYHPPGPMTAREVMQFIGTEIGRKMYNNVWVEATIRRIKNDAPLMAVICDTRFPNEVNGIIQNGGHVIRLLRDPSHGNDVLWR